MKLTERRALIDHIVSEMTHARDVLAYYKVGQSDEMKEQFYLGVLCALSEMRGYANTFDVEDV